MPAVSLDDLKMQLEAVRKKLNAIWEEKNFTDPELIAVSEEFDRLMNEYVLLINLNR